MPSLPSARPLKLFLAGALSAAICLAETSSPERISPPEDASCAVCGMHVANYPEWVARVTYDDGTELYFDGPKDLFRYLSKSRSSAEKRTIVERAVTTYYEGVGVSAQAAYFVIGSDVLGPMGYELVPHGTLDDAEEFLADHKGKHILRINDITTEILKELK